MEKYLKEIYLRHKLDTPELRREELNNYMRELNDQGMDCSACSGLCCTYAHNSMLVTPLEAIELYLYLKRKGRIDESLVSRLKLNISEFRLDKEIFIGKGREFRRNYTCPFFNEGGLGCSVSPKHKPYGCLGFNSKEKGVNVAGKCGVYDEAHHAREQKYEIVEKLVNEEIAEHFSLLWSKKNIPAALLEIINLNN